MRARVNASVRNMKANPPTNPAIAARSASSSPSGKRSTNASASRIPAANAAEYDLPLAPNSPPSNANKLAPAKPIAATAAMRIAFTGAAPLLPLPARGAPPVDLETVGADLEIAADLGQPSKIQRTLLELRHAAAILADEVVVVVLGQLVARAVAEVEPAHQSQLREQVQRPVHRYEPDPRTPRPNSLQALVLLGPNRLQDRHPLRSRLEPPTPDLPDYPLKLQNRSASY